LHQASNQSKPGSTSSWSRQRWQRGSMVRWPWQRSVRNGSSHTARRK